MAVNVTSRTGNVKNKRSHALNATKKRQNLNLQVHRLENGKKVRMSAKEKRTLMKNHLIFEESDFNYKDLLKAMKKFNIKGALVCESPNIEIDTMILKNITKPYNLILSII